MHPRQNPSNAAQESAPALQLHSRTRLSAAPAIPSIPGYTILDGDWSAEHHRDGGYRGWSSMVVGMRGNRGTFRVISKENCEPS